MPVVSESHICGKARRGRIEQQQVTVLHVIGRSSPFEARGHWNHHILKHFDYSYR